MKNKLFRNVLIGATLGCIISLFDRETKRHLQKYVQKTKKCLKQPTSSIKCMKEKVDEWKDQFDEQSDQLLNVVEQVEETINTFSKKKK